MNAIVTSIFALLITGFAFSQGPAKSPTIVNRKVVVKDSLGKVLKLSDYSEQLKSKEWILHPEKNEQGKVLYILLKRVTPSEKELLSDERVSTVSEVQFNKVKRGKFILKPKDGMDTRIRRKGNKQVECSKNADGSKQKTKYSIVWLDDASYILKPWNKVTEMAKTPRYKIVEVTDEFYAIRVVDKSSLGGVVKIYFR